MLLITLKENKKRDLLNTNCVALKLWHNMLDSLILIYNYSRFLAERRIGLFLKNLQVR